jgi:hypothetical protein
LLDAKRSFWEENFLHCLRFEQHTYCAFMLREDHWRDLRMHKGIRIPRPLLIRLDQAAQQESEAYTDTIDVEDEQAQKILMSVEQMSVFQYVLQLPEKLKATFCSSLGRQN